MGYQYSHPGLITSMDYPLSTRSVSFRQVNPRAEALLRHTFVFDHFNFVERVRTDLITYHFLGWGDLSNYYFC